MNLHHMLKVVEKTIKANSPAILAALGVSGAITTAYLAHQAGARKIILIEEDKDQRRDENGHVAYLGRQHTFDLLWKNYIPTTVAGTLTIVCIIGATTIGTRRTAASFAAYSLSERAFSEYKEKVVETYGERKEQTIRDEIAKDRIAQNPPSSREVILVGPGNVLCFEMHTGRYFKSDMETLRRAENDLNARVIKHDHASASDFYYAIGLPFTQYSSSIGWTSDRLMELQFSTVLADDGQPCLAFEYNYIAPF